MAGNEDGAPSSDLVSILSPALKPIKVTYRGLQHCESAIGKQEKAPRIPKVSDTNFAPSIRNHVDHISATVGRLLVFKVPEVTATLFPFCSVRGNVITVNLMFVVPYILVTYVLFNSN
jgi:hypothetical protein